MALQGSKTQDKTLSRASALYFEGDMAAISGKWAKPYDLHTLSLRNDLGTCLHLLHTALHGFRRCHSL